MNASPWKDHIDKVAKKAAKGIGILRRSKGFLDKDTLKTVYIVLPHFDYCSLVWHNSSKALQNKLQKLQNKAGRIITGDSYEIASDTVSLNQTLLGHFRGHKGKTIRNLNDTNNEG